MNVDNTNLSQCEKYPECSIHKSWIQLIIRDQIHLFPNTQSCSGIHANIPKQHRNGPKVFHRPQISHKMSVYFQIESQFILTLSSAPADKKYTITVLTFQSSLEKWNYSWSFLSSVDTLPFWAHLCVCTVGSYASLSVCMYVCMSVTRSKFISHEPLHLGPWRSRGSRSALRSRSKTISRLIWPAMFKVKGQLS